MSTWQLSNNVTLLLFFFQIVYFAVCFQIVNFLAFRIYSQPVGTFILLQRSDVSHKNTTRVLCIFFSVNRVNMHNFGNTDKCLISQSSEGFQNCVLFVFLLSSRCKSQSYTIRKEPQLQCLRSQRLYNFIYLYIYSTIKKGY